MRPLALALLAASMAAAAPLVSDIRAAAVPVPAGGSTSVSVVASGAALTYAWSASGGTIAGSGPTITWTAPAVGGTYTVRCVVGDGGGTSTADIDLPVSAGLSEWPNATPPAGAPFGRSSLFAGLALTGRTASYHFADTWYPSWGADDALYSPWQDGMLLTDPYSGLSTEAWDQPSESGWARITGSSPEALTFTNAGVIRAPRDPYGGRYPAGSLHHDGVWYYGSYLTTNEGGSTAPTVTTPDGEFNWGVLGPFLGFHVSTDNGQTWTPTPWTGTNPMFGEPTSFGGKVKIGIPHFVDFGRNMEHSPDGKAYMVAHGAVDPDPNPRPANLSWINGDQLYMLRVTPSIATLNDPGAWEFFAGHDVEGNATWTSNLGLARPILDWNNRCGNVSMTWNPALGRYLMFVTDGWPTTDTMDTYLLESTSLTGPWSLVQWWEDFGPQGYFFNIPSKFIAADGLSFWTLYSANFTWASDPWIGDPPVSGYHACFLEVALRHPVRGRVDGVALPPLDLAAPAPPAAAPAPGLALPLRSGDNANGDRQINDRCSASTSPSVSALALLFGLLAFAARRRS